MIVCNLNKPMDWKTFNNLTADMQQEYLRGLRERYSVTDLLIAKMFGVDASTIALRRKALGIASNGRMPRSDSEAGKRIAEHWQEFLDRADDTPRPETTASAKVELDPLETPVPVADTPTTPIEATVTNTVDMAAATKILDNTDALHLSDLTATFKGEFNATKFFLWLTKLPFPTGNVNIRIEVTGEC